MHRLYNLEVCGPRWQNGLEVLAKLHPLSRFHNLGAVDIRLQILLDWWCNHLFVFIRVSHPSTFYQSLRHSRSSNVSQRARSTKNSASADSYSVALWTVQCLE